MKTKLQRRKIPAWSWLWFGLGFLYLALPLVGTFDFSLQMQRDVLSFKAYAVALGSPEFVESFLYSVVVAVITIAAGIALCFPTAYWVNLKVPQARRIVEFITLLPFVVPAIILVFGMIRIYSAPLKLPFTELVIFPSLTNSELGTNVLLVAGYVVLALPYMYRAVDTGLRAMDVRALTEAAQSLGANWFTILARVIFPNLRSALLSGSLLTFAIVVGEVIFASFLGRPAFGPYLWLLGQHRAYEPAALSFASFLLTWAAMGLIQLVSGEQGQVSGAH